MKSGVYAIIRKDTNDMYIGSSKDIVRRLDVHFSQLRLNKHHSKYLQRVYNKYGEHVLETRVLEYCGIDTIIDREQYYIDTFQPVFNTNDIAGRTVRFGFKHSEETR